MTEHSDLDLAFHEAMLNVYRTAKAEANYNATAFLKMVVDHDGVDAARRLINSDAVSDGYTTLWERGRLDLTVEAVVVNTEQFHALFTEKDLQICRDRLKQYGYQS